MPTKANGNTYKVLLTAAIGIIVTLVGVWAAIGKGAITQKDLEHYDQNYSSYAKDKNIISEKLNRISKQMDETVSKKIDEMLKIVHRLDTQQSIIKDRLKIEKTD